MLSLGERFTGIEILSRLTLASDRLDKIFIIATWCRIASSPVDLFKADTFTYYTQDRFPEAVCKHFRGYRDFGYSTNLSDIPEMQRIYGDVGGH